MKRAISTVVLFLIVIFGLWLINDLRKALSAPSAARSPSPVVATNVVAINQPEAAKPATVRPIVTYAEMKAKVVELCERKGGFINRVDHAMFAINGLASTAKENGVPLRAYYTCLGQATGCLELQSLTDQCSQK